LQKGVRQFFDIERSQIQIQPTLPVGHPSKEGIISFYPRTSFHHRRICLWQKAPLPRRGGRLVRRSIGVGGRPGWVTTGTDQRICPAPLAKSAADRLLLYYLIFYIIVSKQSFPFNFGFRFNMSTNVPELSSKIRHRARITVALPEYPFQSVPRDPIKVLWQSVNTRTWPFRLAYHQAMEWHYIKRGEGYYFVAGQFHRFGKHSLLIILPGESHAFVPETSNCIVLKALIQVNPARLKIRIPSAWPRQLLMDESEANDLELILGHINNELKQKKYGWERMVGYHSRLMVCLLERVQHEGRHVSQSHPLVSQISTYIEEHYAEPLTVASLCRIFGYSVHYLPRLFKETSGVGLKHYLLQRRLMEAKRILQSEPGLTAQAVAKRAGFNEATAFYRVFKQFASFAPETYRRFCK